MDYDFIAVGGGAAGLCAAVRAKEAAPHLRVALFEGLDRVGKKLSLTGNGQCNITNANITLARYHGRDVSFASPALQAFSNRVVADWFASLGVLIVFTADGRAYPNSYQASSVVDAMRFRAQECGVDMLCGQRVEALEKRGGQFLVRANGIQHTARFVLLATGLFAGGERLGCDGSGLNFARRLGHRIIEYHPAIVQVKTDTAWIKQLKGVKVDAAATVCVDGKALQTETGEILFTDYGLSGPPILQLGRAVSTCQSACEIRLNFLPEFTEQALTDLLIQRAKLLGARPLQEFFTGLLQKRLGQVLLKFCGFSLADPVSRLKEADCKRIAKIAQAFPLQTAGTKGFSQAQVATGGLDTRDFSAETMESKLVPGLFAAGEILDIDGDCGGFNLQWAFSSAMCAAERIASEFREANL